MKVRVRVSVRLRVRVRGGRQQEGWLSVQSSALQGLQHCNVFGSHKDFHTDFMRALLAIQGTKEFGAADSGRKDLFGVMP